MAIWLGNWLGRKRAVILGTSIIVVGATIQTASFSLAQLIVARVFTGLGTGINTSTIPMWQSETAKPHHRGRMVMIETSLVVFGVMLADYVDLGFLFLEPSSISWRFPIAFQIVFCLPILAIIPFLPESPRWLMIKDREAEAITFFCALWDLPADNLRVQDELQAVKHAKEEAVDSGFTACFRPNHNRNLHRTILAYAIMVGQQLTGISEFVLSTYA
jgi:MFS family permease